MLLVLSGSFVVDLGGVAPLAGGGSRALHTGKRDDRLPTGKHNETGVTMYRHSGALAVVWGVITLLEVYTHRPWWISALTALCAIAYWVRWKFPDDQG